VTCEKHSNFKKHRMYFGSAPCRIITCGICNEKLLETQFSYYNIHGKRSKIHWRIPKKQNEQEKKYYTYYN